MIDKRALDISKTTVEFYNNGLDYKSAFNAAKELHKESYKEATKLSK